MCLKSVCANSHLELLKRYQKLISKMIRISGLSGEMASFNITKAMQLWDVATKVKKEFGIPRGEQVYYQGYEKMSKAMFLKGPIDVTMMRVRVKCTGCGRKQQKRKYQACGRCRDAHYCCSECQRQHWKYHKADCKASKTQKDEAVQNECEHDYTKSFPSGARDNNEYDLVCKKCGHTA